VALLIFFESSGDTVEYKQIPKWPGSTDTGLHTMIQDGIPEKNFRSNVRDSESKLRQIRL
jgi:hypothetical protein